MPPHRGSLFTVCCAVLLVGFASSFSLSMSSSSSSSSTSTSTTKPFALNVKLAVKPERRSEFLSVIKTDRSRTMETEPAAMQFVLGEDANESNIFYLHEQYAGEEGFHAHTQTPHFAEWGAFVETNPFADGGEPVIDLFWGAHEPQKRGTASDPTYCLNVELCVKPERRDEFLKVIENNARGSNNDEPLCRQYDYGESTTTPNTFYFHEQYDGKDGGREGFDAHAASPHFQVWETFATTDPFTKPPIVSFYRTIE